MAYVMEIPVDGGGRLLVEKSDGDLPGDLELAARLPGEIVARTAKSLEQALDQMKPAVNAVLTWLTTMSPSEVAVEFGIVLGAEAGAVVAKGTGEVHFTVTLTWQPPDKAVTNAARNRSDQAPSGARTDA
jgi:hypothetical protein